MGAITTAGARSATGEQSFGWPGIWLLLLMGCVLVIGAVDTTLVALSSNFFASVFNGVYIDGGLWYSGYVVASVALDPALVFGT